MSIPAPSRHGVEFIAQHEGFSAKPYWDGAGKVWTIGYGQTGGIGPHTPPWSQEHALEVLQHHVDHIYFPPIQHACAAVGLSLNQHQVDALTSLVYNVGPGILGPEHTMGQEIKAKNIHGMADAFLLYDMAGGKPILKPRREQERSLFLS